VICLESLKVLISALRRPDQRIEALISASRRPDQRIEALICIEKS
jgi:hypothetical protein